MLGFDNLLYFTAHDETHGQELWQSDGTEAGTFLIKDIHSGPASSSPSTLTLVKNTLYFVADDGLHGEELWAYEIPHTVTSLAGTGGSISPESSQLVDDGTTTSFTLTPDAGYSIYAVTGCNGTLNNNIYTTGPITADCTVLAFFREIAALDDSDSDGIDDAWEKFWFNDLTTADESTDYDNDGYSDLQEFLNWLAGETDPKGEAYNPKVKNAPGGTGYDGRGHLQAVYKLLL